MTLKLNGYSTAQFGKCHEVPVWETSPMGPFDQWPTGGGGFEYFYGFIGGETNQWYPAIYEGTTPIEPEKTPEEGYHFTEDMTNKAIKWTRQQKALMPDKPFFMYFAPGACHAPHHVPKEWIDKYKGKFDQGWDKLREEIFARQKKLGVIPADAELTARPAEIPAWDETPEDMRPIFAREMEVYAAFLEHADHHLGRLIDTLEGSGDPRRHADLLHHRRQRRVGRRHAERLLQRDGDPERHGHARDARVPDSRRSTTSAGLKPTTTTPSAGRTRWTRPTSGPSRSRRTWGGTRNGTIVHWPNGIKAKGEVRSQFHHVIDVAPTILEAAGLPHPTIVNSIQQAPIEGVSMLYAFNDAKAAERHETQYFEMFCNRGIYHKGWTAVTRHGVPWLGAYKRASTRTCGSCTTPTTTGRSRRTSRRRTRRSSRSCSGSSSSRRRKYSVLPLDDRTFERFNPDLAGRPQLIKGKSQILFGGMGRLTENSIVSIKNKSYSITADLDVPKSGAEGVIIAQGGNTNGWSLYAKGGKLKYCYNFFGITLTFVEATQPIPAGHHQVRMEFKYDGGGLAKGGGVTLYVDGKPVGQGRVEQTVPMAFSADETCDVGKEGRLAGVAGLRADGQRVQRRGELGADRPGEGRPRPHDLAGGALQGRDGAAVNIAGVI